MNCVSSILVTGCVGTFDHGKIAVHPGVNVALHGNHLRCLPAIDDWGRAGRLRFIPRDVASHRIGQRMDVVGGLIAGGDLEFLVRIHGQDVRDVLAALLIKSWLVRGDRSGLIPG